MIPLIRETSWRVGRWALTLLVDVIVALSMAQISINSANHDFCLVLTRLRLKVMGRHDRFEGPERTAVPQRKTVQVKIHDAACSTVEGVRWGLKDVDDSIQHVEEDKLE